jgi:hypothetical protein
MVWQGALLVGNANDLIESPMLGWVVAVGGLRLKYHFEFDTNFLTL